MRDPVVSKIINEVATALLGKTESISAYSCNVEKHFLELWQENSNSHIMLKLLTERI